MADLTSLLQSVRELTFDRIVAPTLYIKASQDVYVTITKDGLTVTGLDESDVKTELLFSDFPTLDEVTGALMASPERYSLSFAPSFIGEEPSTSLQPIPRTPLGDVITLYRKRFFSDSYIRGIITDYLHLVKGVTCDELQFEAMVAEIVCPEDRHLIIWTAYNLVEKRRLYTLAGSQLGSSAFTNSGFNDFPSGIGTTTDASINVSVGDVWSISESPSEQYVEEPIDGIGVDNLFGDKASFWYKLQLWLRDRLEQLFGDYSLRKDQVLQGNIDLEKDINFYAHYDNYPFTISPYVRDIIQESY